MHLLRCSEWRFFNCQFIIQEIAALKLSLLTRHGTFPASVIQRKYKGKMNMNHLIIICQEVLAIAQDKLLALLPFLSRAIHQLVLRATDDFALATDSSFVYYNPTSLLHAYKTDHNYVMRALMHVLLHCMFRHMMIGQMVNPGLWDLACDMAVEGIIKDLNLPQMASGSAKPKMPNVMPLTAERIYRYLIEHPLTPDELDEYQRAYAIDDHCLWYSESLDEDANHETEQFDEAQNACNADDYDNNGEGDSLSHDPDGSGDDGEDRQSASDDEQEGCGSDNKSAAESERGDNHADTGSPSSGEKDVSDGSGGAEDLASELVCCGSKTSTKQEELWEDIANTIAMDLETFSRQYGAQVGNLIQSLRAIKRETVDYADFLRKFATHAEVTRVSQEEFDLNYYTYGLKIYGNTPLIEPLEYSDDKRIREFVIAIDTSGSVAGDLVQAYLQKSWNIIKQQDCFTCRFVLHIIQYDSKIQEDAVIASQEDFDRYIKTMTIHGLGGTDFRRVFEYVNRLRQEGKLRRLKGLLYFTDGFGIYPAKAPDYKAAFVFLEKDNNAFSKVPPWAMKVIMSESDIIQNRGKTL